MSLLQYQQAQVGTNGEHEEEQQVKWKSPRFRRYKVNWEVAVNSRMKTIGVEVLVRDHLGEVHTALSRTIQSQQEPVVAEAIGALIAAGTWDYKILSLKGILS